METLTVAVTHQTITRAQEDQLLASQTIAIGTSIKAMSREQMDGNARIDLELLDRLAREGGFAIVTYGKDGHRYFCRFAPGTAVEPLRGLHSLKAAEVRELPANLRQFNTKGRTILELVASDRETVITEASKLRWNS